MAEDQFEPEPLTAWVRGTLRMHFAGGHVADIELCQETADRVRRQVEGREGPDHVEAAGSRWFQYSSSEVVLLEWSPGPDYGWGAITPTERTALRQAGHPKGTLGSLVRMWDEEAHVPSFCAVALHYLHLSAKKGMPLREWERIARTLEGEGARRVLGDAAAEVPDLSDGVDDSAVPEDAPLVDQEMNGSDREGPTSSSDDASTNAEPDDASSEND